MRQGSRGRVGQPSKGAWDCVGMGMRIERLWLRRVIVVKEQKTAKVNAFVTCLLRTAFQGSSSSAVSLRYATSPSYQNYCHTKRLQKQVIKKTSFIW